MDARWVMIIIAIDRPLSVTPRLRFLFCSFPQLKLPQIQKIMMDFEKESEIMDMKEEMMSDAIDDAMGEEGDDEER